MDLVNLLPAIAQAVAIAVAVVAAIVGGVALRRQRRRKTVVEPPPLDRLSAWHEAQKLSRRRAERKKGSGPAAQPLPSPSRFVFIDGGVPAAICGSVYRGPARDLLARSARRGRWELEAMLVREPDSRWNTSPVALHVEGRFVGCLPREQAAAYAGLVDGLLAHDTVALCKVLIVPRPDVFGREVLDVIHYLPSVPPSLESLLADDTTATA